MWKRSSLDQVKIFLIFDWSNPGHRQSSQHEFRSQTEAAAVGRGALNRNHQQPKSRLRTKGYRLDMQSYPGLAAPASASYASFRAMAFAGFGPLNYEVFARRLALGRRFGFQRGRCLPCVAPAEGRGEVPVIGPTAVAPLCPRGLGSCRPFPAATAPHVR